MVVAIIAGRGGVGKTSQVFSIAKLFQPTQWAILEKKDERGGSKIKDPMIRVDGDNGTLLNQSLWCMIKKMMFEDRLGWMYNGSIKIYLNGKEVEKPPEMEEGE